MTAVVVAAADETFGRRCGVLSQIGNLGQPLLGSPCPLARVYLGNHVPVEAM